MYRHIGTKLVTNPHWQYRYIYMIKNKKNGRIYIGSSSDVDKRVKTHFSSLKYGRHTAKLLQEDYDNGSEEDFEVEVIDKSVCDLEASALECLYMVIYRTYDERFGYNSQDGRFLSSSQRKPTKFMELILNNLNK